MGRHTMTFTIEFHDDLPAGVPVLVMTEPTKDGYHALVHLRPGLDPLLRMQIMDSLEFSREIGDPILPRQRRRLAS